MLLILFSPLRNFTNWPTNLCYFWTRTYFLLGALVLLLLFIWAVKAYTVYGTGTLESFLMMNQSICKMAKWISGYDFCLTPQGLRILTWWPIYEKCTCLLFQNSLAPCDTINMMRWSPKKRDQASDSQIFIRTKIKIFDTLHRIDILCPHPEAWPVDRAFLWLCNTGAKELHRSVLYWTHYLQE